MRSFVVSFMAVALASACGGKADHAAAPATPPSAEPAAEHGEMESEHHGSGVAEIDSFHDVLAPLWHAEAGDARKTNTCAAIPSFKEQAMGIVGRARADHAAWEGNANALLGAVDTLGTACAGTGAFDGAFTDVHNAFHVLLEAATEGTETEHATVGH